MDNKHTEQRLSQTRKFSRQDTAEEVVQSHWENPESDIALIASGLSQISKPEVIEFEHVVKLVDEHDEQPGVKQDEQKVVKQDEQKVVKQDEQKVVKQDEQPVVKQDEDQVEDEHAVEPDDDQQAKDISKVSMEKIASRVAEDDDEAGDFPSEDEFDKIQKRQEAQRTDLDSVKDDSEEEETMARVAFKSFMHGLKDERSKQLESMDKDDDNDAAASYPVACHPDSEEVLDVIVDEPVDEYDAIRCGVQLKRPELLKEPPAVERAVIDSNLNILNLCWSFGFDTKNPVHNLTTDYCSGIFYTCAHTGIIYDHRSNTQHLLRGHLNSISCTCISHNKRWIVTGDTGPDSMVIVWDSISQIPVRTIFDCSPEGGVASCTLTIDSRFLATISSAAKQIVAIWDWTTESEVPICTAELDSAYGFQKYIHFNSEDSTQFVTNSDSQVIFYSWQSGKLNYCTPNLSDSDFNRVVGDYSQSIYFSGGTTRALTGTSVGNVVVWEGDRPWSPTESSETTPRKKALKLIKLFEKGITVLTATEHYIVVGDSVGQIKFYEQGLTLVHAYQQLHVDGPISSISFAYLPDFADREHVGQYVLDSTLRAKRFIVRDFILSTSSGVIACMQVSGTELTILEKGHNAPTNALSSHPSLPILAVGSRCGLLQLWQYAKHFVIASRFFDDDLQIESCAYDSLGECIAIGFTNGSIRIVDAVSLNDLLHTPYQFTTHTITHVAFSNDSRFFATADNGHVVSIYKKDCRKNTLQPYLFVGRYKSHYKKISDLIFGINEESGKPRLLSIGEDRMMAEYDLEKSTRDNIILLGTDRIEQSSLPLSMLWYPIESKEQLLLTSNSDYKLKLYNSLTKMCRKTIRAPMFGGPVKKMIALKSDQGDGGFYVAYINDNKVGTILLPLDGNPHNACAAVAHPEGIGNIVGSHNGKYFFTTGCNDTVVHMWSCNKQALEAQSKLAGEGIVPFYTLLDNGQKGDEFREIEQLFYYAQIRQQGLNSSEPREIATDVLLTEVPYMMRGLGFYPSEQSINEMTNEVKYSNYLETGGLTTKINLFEFLKLYVNHRPAFGIQMDKVEEAFRILGVTSDADGTSSVNVDRLLYLLQSKGEEMTEAELTGCLTILLGLDSEGGTVLAGCVTPPLEEGNLDDLDLDQLLPQTFTAESFVDTLLQMKPCKQNYCS